LCGIPLLFEISAKNDLYYIFVIHKLFESDFLLLCYLLWVKPFVLRLWILLTLWMLWNVSDFLFGRSTERQLFFFNFSLVCSKRKFFRSKFIVILLATLCLNYSTFLPCLDPSNFFNDNVSIRFVMYLWKTSITAVFRGILFLWQRTNGKPIFLIFYLDFCL